MLHELRERFGGDHFVENIIAKKILNVGYQWHVLFHDTSKYYNSCDACQRTKGLATQSLAKLVTILP